MLHLPRHHCRLDFRKHRKLYGAIGFVVIASASITMLLLTGTGKHTPSARTAVPFAASDGMLSETTAPNNNQQASNTVKPPSQAIPALPAVPADILDLRRWKLTLPTADPNHLDEPQEITQPQLAGFQKTPYFQLNSEASGVNFRANVDGITTSHSGYPRSELREMNGDGSPASWSMKSGTHSMTVREAVTHLPVAKPEVVTAQIHDDSDDVIMIKLSNKLLYVESDSKNIGTLDDSYSLGTPYTIQITASNSTITVAYNGQQKININKNGSSYYFKAGCYTQSNLKKGDDASAYAEVTIYSLSVSHS